MENIKFTHLHLHSEYSLLDSTAKIKEIISRTKELNMDSVAITDHGVMYGVIDFYKEALENGIKPIIGCEVYVASGDRRNKDNVKENFYYHLVLLAENNEGYQNLLKIVSIGFTEGYYYKPRVDLEILRKYSKGLIALSACLSGPVAKNILRVSYEKALETAIMYNEIFGQNNFFLELQDHGIDEQKIVVSQILKISEETKIPLVCTNDTHYIYQEDYKAHDVFLCIQTGKTIQDEDRMSYGTDQLYLKSPEEMAKIFPFAKEALENTYKISKRCNVTIEFNNYKLPKFKIKDNQDSFEYLQNLCLEGLKFRYGELTENLEERLNYELNTIKEMGFVDYFLIVWDFIKYAYDNGIIVGPGRGSAAGSIVAYSLRITNIDPIKYDLLFERFLNPERISMPDIDIDFCYERRQEVIDYVVEKYGAEKVAQIITFGTLAARAAIRDVGRALDVPYATVDIIAKMIPMELGITIEKALQMNPELNNIYENNEEIKKLINMSLRLEGLPRHASTHAAGVVICNEPVTEYVPLNQNDGIITTQFTMTTLEELGLLKMDFLGLRTLTVIRDTVSEIKRNYNIDIDFDKMSYDDPNIFDMISLAKTDGVFQLESPGMKSFMKDLKPRNIEDIIAGISLYRPGPMDFIPKYVYGKNHKDNIKYTHPKLEPILKQTYGCIVYQEQVMQIVRDLGGYSLGRSDLVRRAMSKKKTEVMAQERNNFIYGMGDEIPGCLKNGIDKESAEKIFDEMTDFAKYAFNKSHAAAYAVIGYQTAWLKYYYPVEFMAALLTSVISGSNTKVAEYILESKKMGIELLPPDVNKSYENFSVSGKSIRFGLAAVKNVGRQAIRAIVNERKNGEYKTFTEFINRVEQRDLNKRCLESLIKAGAFDSMGKKRRQLMNSYKKLLDGINNTRKNNVEGQLDFFSIINVNIYTDDFIDVPEFNKREMLNMEKEVLGIYVSGHPLDSFREYLIQKTNTISIDLMADSQSRKNDGEKVKVGGLITSKSIKYTKNNKAMSFLTVEDLYGVMEIILFPNVHEKFNPILVENIFVIIEGVINGREDEDYKIICNDLSVIEEEKEKLWLKIPADKEIDTKEIIDTMKYFQGSTKVMIYDEKERRKYLVDEKYWIRIDDLLLHKLRQILGEANVIISRK